MVSRDDAVQGATRMQEAILYTLNGLWVERGDNWRSRAMKAVRGIDPADLVSRMRPVPQKGDHDG